MSPAELARVIDHTMLKAEAREEEIRKLVSEAVEHRFAAVCVNCRWVGLVSEMLRAAGVEDGKKTDMPVAACAVVGFPLGANRSVQKAIEAGMAVKEGAREIDMVVSLGDLLAGDLEYVKREVFEVVRTARAARQQTVVKVILETAALNEEQTAMGCRAALEGGADFVKTSTGFHAMGGATVEAVGWLVKYGKSAGLKVKASGGIRDLAGAKGMLEAGADRLGMSASVGVIGEARGSETRRHEAAVFKNKGN